MASLAARKKSSAASNKAALASQKARKQRTESSSSNYKLRLYTSGNTHKSLTAFANLKKICDEYLHGEYQIEVIDLIKNPQLARGDQILAIPTLVRQLPVPIRKIIGDLSNTEQVLVGLDIKPFKK